MSKTGALSMMGPRCITILFLLAICGGGTAFASDIQSVTLAADNPGALEMFEYMPADLAAGAPLVVVMHGCSQGADEYVTQAGWQALAIQYGFALLAPQQRSANNASRCFNWFRAEDSNRDVGEALSIRNMIAQTIATHDLDADRVFATGLSAGGFMTTALLATYPDVLAGGGVIAGGPFGCADSVQTAINCMSGGVSQTPGAWAQHVRDAFAFQGTYPRLSIWHGSADATINVASANELVKQWTELHGMAEAIANEDSVGGYPRLRFGDVVAGDPVVVELVTVTGMEHGVAIAPPACGDVGTFALDFGVCSSLELVRFWGLVGGGDEIFADAGVDEEVAAADASAEASGSSGGGCSVSGAGTSRGPAFVLLGLFLMSIGLRRRRR